MVRRWFETTLQVEDWQPLQSRVHQSGSQTSTFIEIHTHSITHTNLLTQQVHDYRCQPLVNLETWKLGIQTRKTRQLINQNASCGGCATAQVCWFAPPWPQPEIDPTTMMRIDGPKWARLPWFISNLVFQLKTSRLKPASHLCIVFKKNPKCIYVRSAVRCEKWLNVNNLPWILLGQLAWMPTFFFS